MLDIRARYFRPGQHIHGIGEIEKIESITPLEKKKPIDGSFWRLL